MCEHYFTIYLTSYAIKIMYKSLKLYMKSEMLKIQARFWKKLKAKKYCWNVLKTKIISLYTYQFSFIDHTKASVVLTLRKTRIL